MRIDARGRDIQDLLKELREFLASKRECYLSIEILIGTMEDAKKTAAFLTMSGCTTEIEKKDNYYIMYVKGIPCCT